MAYVITDACVSCGTCEGECPVGAISAGDENTKSLQIPALTAEHVLVHVLQALSSRVNS